jgi:hypothetical protein
VEVLPEMQSQVWFETGGIDGGCDGLGPDGPHGFVPLNPASNCRAGFSDAMEIVLPDKLLFEAPKEALDDTVLFGRMRNYELLPQPGNPKCGA